MGAWSRLRRPVPSMGPCATGGRGVLLGLKVNEKLTAMGGSLAQVFID